MNKIYNIFTAKANDQSHSSADSFRNVATLANSSINQPSNSNRMKNLFLTDTFGNYA